MPSVTMFSVSMLSVSMVSVSMLTVSASLAPVDFALMSPINIGYVTHLFWFVISSRWTSDHNTGNYFIKHFGVNLLPLSKLHILGTLMQIYYNSKTVKLTKI
jgi:hypothetical protein